MRHPQLCGSTVNGIERVNWDRRVPDSVTKGDSVFGNDFEFKWDAGVGNHRANAVSVGLDFALLLDFWSEQGLDSIGHET